MWKDSGEEPEWKRKKRARRAKDTQDSLQRYLEKEEGDQINNPLPYCTTKRQDSSSRHKLVASMGAAVHSIPAMSTEVERVFSSTKILVSERWNRLGDDIIEASECLKAWQKKQLTPTYHQDIRKMDEMLDDLDERAGSARPIGNTGPKVLYLIANASPERPVPLNLTIDDWSQCEWLYVVDLGKEQFEVHSGFTPFSAEIVGERFDALDAARGQFNSVPRCPQMGYFNSLPSPDQLCQDCTPTSDDDRSTDSESDTESYSNTQNETGFSPTKSQPPALKKRKHNAEDTLRSKRPKRLPGNKSSPTAPKRRATETGIENLGEALDIKTQNVIALIQWHTNTADLIRRVNAEQLRQVNNHIRRHG
ncbi:hypothetical protein LTR70_007379 [Exophiala xenobiotica]|uniref:HAT C-terminal dimerisation domain-containing protein n=1 Tax=Lithohypha guttulata TaxID=1690604 RepID=A0ABR0K4K8_9EURO|nr:hypothetical protein LTR24_006892 [Lithohypha guttulata]KAK5313957.1 hypothetical protein LTR70_007379 [Exophiala xenobiotica]